MLRKVFSTFIFLSVVFSLYVVASSAGKTGRTQLSDTPGCTCHGSTASQSVQVVISGPDLVVEGSTNFYQVSISGGPASAAGTNIAASAGSLSPISATLKESGGELTHTAPVPFGVNSEIIFEFEYTAPPVDGEVIIAANGNSVDLNGGNSGDEWTFAPNKVVTVQPATIVEEPELMKPERFTLQQNYPNPFNPVTMIDYNVTEYGMVELSVFDALGKKIKTLVNDYQYPGSYSVQFKAGHLPSGIYFYSMRSAGNFKTLRMTLTK